MYNRGRAGRQSTSFRGRGRGQQTRYIAPQSNTQQVQQQRQSRRQFIDQQGFQTNQNDRKIYRNSSQDRNQDMQRGLPRRSRSTSNFNRQNTFQITEKFPSRKIFVPKYEKNQRMVHTCSTVNFEMDLFVVENNNRNNYTMLSYITMAFFFGNFGPVDGKTLVPSKKKNTQKRSLHEVVDFTMEQIIEKLQTLPRMSTEDENFSERICMLFDNYSDWCHHHLKHDGGFKKIHDITRKNNWRKNNETGSGNENVSDQNTTEQA